MSHDPQSDIDILLRFLNKPLSSTSGIFDEFRIESGAIYRGQGLRRFCYIRGSRSDKVILVAHADTVYDDDWAQEGHPVSIPGLTGPIRQGSTVNQALGADDRAGCAMLWLLRDLGHSLLITSGEEHGQLGSVWIMDDVANRDIADEINHEHQFAIQLDRRGGGDFKCYDVGTDEFRRYVIENTRYVEPDRDNRTDIKVLCRDICGVNLSIGYSGEHHPDESLNVDQWAHTLDLCRTWLHENELPRYPR
jgi:hypothetical protein